MFIFLNKKKKKNCKNRKGPHGCVTTFWLHWKLIKWTLLLWRWSLQEKVPLSLHTKVSLCWKLFFSVVSVVWLSVSIFAILSHSKMFNKEIFLIPGWFAGFIGLMGLYHSYMLKKILLTSSRHVNVSHDFLLISGKFG